MRKGDLITINVHHLCGTMDLAKVLTKSTFELKQLNMDGV